MASFLETLVGGTAAGIGFVLGAGATLAGAQRLRPLVKQAIRGYIIGVERAREVTAELAETVEDLYVEARAEYETGAGARGK